MRAFSLRITTEQIAIIRQAAVEAFGPDVHVWLFGSRVDDTRRGGDIDLYVEARRPHPEALDQQARFWSLLQRRLGERRIDIVVASQGRTTRSIDVTALRTGVPLL